MSNEKRKLGGIYTSLENNQLNIWADRRWLLLISIKRVLRAFSRISRINQAIIVFMIIIIILFSHSLANI